MIIDTSHPWGRFTEVYVDGERVKEVVLVSINHENPEENYVEVLDRDDNGFVRLKNRRDTENGFTSDGIATKKLRVSFTIKFIDPIDHYKGSAFLIGLERVREKLEKVAQNPHLYSNTMVYSQISEVPLYYEVMLRIAKVPQVEKPQV